MSSTFPSVSAFDAENFPRHRWYFFKEAFSPSIVGHLMAQSDLSKGAVIVDPFSGSGTTALAASMAGYSGLGIEVNPFMRFVSEAKAVDSSGAVFLRGLKRSLAAATAKKKSPLERFSTFSEKSELSQKRGKWLFNSSVLRAFHTASIEADEIRGDVGKLVKLCLISAAMDVANAVKDGKCLRYRKNWIDFKFDRASFEAAAMERGRQIAEDLDESPAGEGSFSVALGDSRGVGFPEQFDLCITSPPYLNSFDYTDVYRPELFLGGFVRDMADLRLLRKATIRSHVQTTWNSPLGHDYGAHYVEAMNDLAKRSAFLWSPKLPAMIQAYFEDMAIVLTRLRSRARANGTASIIVSTSAYAGVEIPVDLILADIAERSGWFLREVVVLRHLKRVSCQQWHELNIRRSFEGPHLRESMIVLDARPRRG